MTTNQHQGTTEGLYSRLADACFTAQAIIEEINEELPNDDCATERHELVNALRNARHSAYDKYRIGYQGVVSDEEFAWLEEWFNRAYITGAWERTEENEVQWDMRLKFVTEEDGDDTGAIFLVLNAEVTQKDDGFKLIDTIVEKFFINPLNGENMTTAVGNAQSQANAFLRGIKRAVRI